MNGTSDTNTDLILGIDIGGTNMRVGLVDIDNNIKSFEQVSTRSIFTDDCEPTNRLAKYIFDYCNSNLNGGIPGGLSIGFPSTINRDRTIVLQTPNISCIPDNFPVVKLLNRSMDIPIFINRDVNNLLLFDLQDLQAENLESVVAIYFGTGIGNAVMLNGKILRGHNGVAGELGHLPIYGNKRRCTCGNISCLETLVSGIALERVQAENFPETPISLLFKKHKDNPRINEFIEGMGQTVAIEVNIFDPDCIILGGGLLQMDDFPKDMLCAAIHRYARKPYPEKSLDIRYSRPNQANGVIGAAIYARKRIADASYL